MSRLSKRWLSPVVIASMAIFAAAVFPRLPAEIPTHFGISGESDDWMPRWPGAFAFSGVAVPLVYSFVAWRRESRSGVAQS